MRVGYDVQQQPPAGIEPRTLRVCAPKRTARRILEVLQIQKNSKLMSRLNIGFHIRYNAMEPHP